MFFELRSPSTVPQLLDYLLHSVRDLYWIPALHTRISALPVFMSNQYPHLWLNPAYSYLGPTSRF